MLKDNPKAQLPTGTEKAPPSYIVGVGASAGGLEALERLFEATPDDTGMAFVVIQHLSPDFKSLTDDILARRTSLPIRQVQDGMIVEPDAIYLLPPRKDMILSGGRLLLTDKDPTLSVALPIDNFFRSLAQDAGQRAIAVVLSGTGSDGSRGIRHVREAGGFVVAQDPESAKFDGMPKSAVATGVVHHVCAPEQIPMVLLRHATKSVPQPTDAADEQVGGGLSSIFRMLRDAYGIDFAAYKPDTVTRRTERRLAIYRLNSYEEYVERLKSDPTELNQLYKDLLIGVTRFFRDSAAFEKLGEEVLPKLLSEIGQDDEFRVWCAGCATGEEPYSLAILILECLARINRSIPVKIFATDVHRASLDVAGAALYGPDSLEGVSPQRLERYFISKSQGYQVTPEVRRCVVFAQHNVLKDAPFTKLDLVSCRNLLIYFQPQAQKKALSMFHFGLKANGVLFLGPSEGPGDLADEFDPLDGRWKIYRKRRDVRLSPDLRLNVPLGPDRFRTAGLPHAAGPTADANLISILDAVLDECLGPGLLINDRREVVRSFSGGSRFLGVQDGWFSADVLDAVRPELRTVLAGALPRAFKDQSTVAYKGLRVQLPDGERLIDVTVKPLPGRRPSSPFALVRFAELGTPADPETPAEIDLGEASREQVLSLETELRSTKETLQAMIEELETSNEELQATNEELVAANEELQSTNEELHSVNEELYTVNAEYQKKIEELTELTTDMDNLLASTEVHTVFLDKHLCIRKFTPKIGETFNLLPHDVGRRFDHFTHGIVHEGLLDDLRSVLQTGSPVERSVQDRHGHWFLLRMLPYQSGGTSGGVVLTLIDIDRVMEAEADAREKTQQLAGILKNSPNWVFIKDLNGRYRLADDAFRELVGCDPVGLTAFDIFPPETAAVLVAQDERVLATGAEDECEVEIPHADGIHTYLSVMFPIRDDSGRITSLGGIRTDVTPLKQAEYQAREAVAQRDRFLAILSHELRNPLAAIVNAAHVVARFGPDDDQSREAAAVIERRSRHMARLLDDLLDVARVARGKIEIRREPLDLTSTVPDVLEEVRRWFEERNLHLHYDRPDGPLMIEGDPARLHQIQVNLLMNAAKYTPEGGRVWLTMSREGDRAVLRVRDEGVGMTPEILSRAFELFVQADNTLERSRGGIGVGLTLVKSIVELHGGTVSAHSDGPGKGSEFVVKLPLIAAAVPAPPSPPPPVPRCEVLLVEDDADIRRSLESILRLDGYDVKVAADGVAAVQLIEQSRPAVALIDIGLPGLDGYELARRVRAKFPNGDGPRLIALTGYGQNSDREAAFAAGFDAHLTKPFDVNELARALSESARDFR